MSPPDQPLATASSLKRRCYTEKYQGQLSPFWKFSLEVAGWNSGIYILDFILFHKFILFTDIHSLRTVVCWALCIEGRTGPTLCPQEHPVYWETVRWVLSFVSEVSELARGLSLFFWDVEAEVREEQWFVQSKGWDRCSSQAARKAVCEACLPKDLTPWSGTTSFHTGDTALVYFRSMNVLLKTSLSWALTLDQALC